MHPSARVIWNPETGLYWSNEDGWGYYCEATVYPVEEAVRVRLPMGGIWVTIGVTI